MSKVSDSNVPSFFDPLMDAGRDREPASAPLLEFFRRRGFDEGYAAAQRDVLDDLVRSAESFLASQPTSSPETRRLLYSFIAHLEAHSPVITGARRRVLRDLD